MTNTDAATSTAPFDITDLTDAEFEELDDLANSDAGSVALTSVLEKLSPEQRANFGFMANGFEPGSNAALEAACDTIDMFAEHQRKDFGDLISARLWADRCAARVSA